MAENEKIAEADNATRPGSDAISRLRLLDAATKGLVDPVFVLDYDGRYIDALGGSEREAYDSLDYVVGRTLHELLAKDLADKFLADVRQVIDSGQPLVYEYQLAAEDLKGNMRDGPTGVQWFQGRIAPIVAEGVSPCVAWVVINITRRRELEAELERLASTDELTGLFNRRAFFAQVESVLDEARESRPHAPVALATLDLDHFKEINDRYGHAVGDAVLQYVSDRMQEASGGCEALGRIGGEEFAVVFKDCSRPDAIGWLETLQNSLDDKPFVLGQELIPIGFSAGIVMANGEDRKPGDLLHRADYWLYEAKSAGRHYVAYPGRVERRKGKG